MAHFEPDTITLLGEGVFPRVSLDLPRSGDGEGQYEALIQEAREHLIQEASRPLERPFSGVSGHALNHDTVTLHVRLRGRVVLMRKAGGEGENSRRKRYIYIS